MTALGRVLALAQDQMDEDEACEHLYSQCPWFKAVHDGEKAGDAEDYCRPAPGRKEPPRLVVKLAAPYVGNADYELAMADFRRTVFTNKRTQMVVMTLQPGQAIGSEVHDDGDQLFMVLSGNGTVTVNEVFRAIHEHSIFAVPQGTRHNVVNTGHAPMRLVTVYAPPQHPPGTVEHVKLTPRTPEASTVPEPTVPPGGPGLFHVKGMQLPPYIQHLWHHLAPKYGKHRAYGMAVGIVKKWAAGVNPGGWKTKSGKGKRTHADVRAAAARNVAMWEADKARAHAQSAHHGGGRGRG